MIRKEEQLEDETKDLQLDMVEYMMVNKQRATEKFLQLYADDSDMIRLGQYSTAHI